MTSEQSGSMRLVLFDIDGTLLRTNGAGMQAIKIAMLNVFGECGSIDALIGGGQTYQQIIEGALEGTSITRAMIRREFQSLLTEIAAALQQLVSENPGRIFPLPGGLELIDRLSRSSSCILGLVTGNSMECSAIKLRTAGYRFESFACNSFGDQAPTRAIQVEQAQHRALRLTSMDLSGSRTVVVGDTLSDITCARETGSRCLIVSTGDHPRQLLQSAGPDFLFDDLTDLEAIEAAIFAIAPVSG